MRYVIVGAGAVGGVMGARLHTAGSDVVLVARGDHLAAIRSRGLEVESPDGTEVLAIPAVGSPAEADLRPDDVVVLAVKTQDTAAALADLVAVAPPSIAVVCAQNGVANEPMALRFFADVYAQCVVLPTTFLTPGVVVQHLAPCPGILDLGRYPSGTDERVEAIAGDLRAAGFACEADPAVMRKKYRKLVMNLRNALDALCGFAARSSDLAHRARDEAEACLAAAGIDVQSHEEQKAWRAAAPTDRALPGDRGSSTWQSLARGQGVTEADWLNGEIVLLGRRHGVPTPVNELLQRELGIAARDGRAPGTVSLDELEERLDATRH